MAPSIWSTSDPNVFSVCTGVDPDDPIGYIKQEGGGWIIAGDSAGRSSFSNMYDAANALADLDGNIAYSDYLLGKQEASRTVRTTADQLKRIIDEGGWKMITASAPRCDDVN